MQAAVSTTLAERFSQVTSWDVFGACRFWTGFKHIPQAAGGPHSSRNIWQPQVAKFNLGALVTPRKKHPSALNRQPVPINLVIFQR